MKKTTGKIKKLLLLTVIYAGVTLAVLFTILDVVNANIVLHSSTPQYSPEVSQPSALATNSADIKLTSLQSTSDISFSSDGQYCISMYNGKIDIVDIKKDQIVHTISEQTAVSKYILMRNQNLIIYFLMNAPQKQLIVKTYNISNEITTTQKTIAVSTTSVLKQVNYASSMSLVFFNIETGSGNNQKDTIYYLNANKTLLSIKTNDIIAEMSPLSKSMTLYYENNNHQLYCHSKSVVSLKNKAVTLLGCDGNDNVYVQSLDNPKLIYVLNNENIIKTINLENTQKFTVFSDKKGLYLIFSDSIINLAGNPIAQINYKNMQFIGMSDSKIFFLKQDGSFTTLDNSI